MNDMRRLDSFLKETLRYTGLGASASPPLYFYPARTR